MKRGDIARLLGKAAAVDNRTVDEITIEAWFEILGALDYDDAMTALTEHRRSSTDYLVPAHIVAGVRAARRARLAQGTAIEGVPDADPDDVPAYLEALRENRVRVADGAIERHRPITQLVAQTAATTRIPARS